jgi:hypothetical protein
MPPHCACAYNAEDTRMPAANVETIYRSIATSLAPRRERQQRRAAAGLRI